MPKHYKFVYPEDKKLFKATVECDIVEVLIPEESWGDPKVDKDLSSIKAGDVRLTVQSSEEKSEIPSFALSVESAIEEFVRLYHADLNADILLKTGKAILAEVPDLDRIVPLAPMVKVLGATVRGFCRIKNELSVSLGDRGNILLQGRMRSGKTSLCDAVTWGLFGVTTPRKAGSTTGSLRADDVVNDEVKECCVSIPIQVGDDIWTIRRTRKRGKSSKIEVLLNDEKWDEQGTLDVQAQIHKIIGMDYDLWRTCVYLGQGSVANFVTDTDKARKELLSRAFGLGMCPSALKLIRKAIKLLDGEKQTLEQKAMFQQGKITTLQQTDYQVDIARWEQDKQNRIQSARNRIDAHKITLNGYQEHLKKKLPWQQEEQLMNQTITELTNQLSKSDSSVRINQIHAQNGAWRAEKDLLARDVNNLRAAYQQLQTGPGQCPTCGQMLPEENKDDHIAEVEEQIQTKTAEIQTFDVRISNLQTELGQITTEGSTATEGLKVQLGESRKRLNDANEALKAIQHIEDLSKSVSADIEKATQEIATIEGSMNPFVERAEKHAQELTVLQTEAETIQKSLTAIYEKQRYQEFWQGGFSAKGLPVLVLRLALQELETHANMFLNELLQGSLRVQLEMTDEDLQIKFFEMNGMEARERTYSQLSGGQRRCVEMAFVPFALSEMIFNRIGVRNPLLIIDELTTHLDVETKPLVCSILQNLNRETILVIDHDQDVQGEFDSVMNMVEGVLS
jgi:DNA repair exonuclease SbcCD ATPase subunit